jgi:hypothetical protein
MPTPLPPNPPNRAYGTTPASELPEPPAEDVALYNQIVEIVTPVDATEPEVKDTPTPEAENDDDTDTAPVPKAPLPRPDWGPDKG